MCYKIIALNINKPILHHSLSASANGLATRLNGTL